MKFIVSSTKLLEYLVESGYVISYSDVVLDKWNDFIEKHPERLKKVEDFLIYINQGVNEEAAKYDSIISKYIRNLLNEMQVRLHNITHKLKVTSCRLFTFITFLFGLCNSLSSFIFHSFWGSSLSRIPA